MDRAYLEIIFLCGMILQVVFHAFYLLNNLSEKLHYFFNKKERVLLIFVGIGFLLLPFIYVFSTWFSYFDYNLPKWLGFPSALLYFFGVWLFFRSYTEMGVQWSPGSRTGEGHQLITTGVFKWVRHPMYAAYAIIAVDQFFMLQNWLVGPAFLVLSVPFYLHRVKREEQHLINYFGDEYHIYSTQTNALFPKIEQFDFSPLKERLKHPFGKKRID